MYKLTTRKFLLSALILSGSALSFGQSAAQVAHVAAGAEFAPGEIVIGFKEGASEFERNRVYQRAGVVGREHIYTKTMRQSGAPGLVRAEIRGSVQDAIADLATDPSVAFAEPNWIYRVDNTTDSYYTNGSLWGMYGANTSPANQFGSGAGAAWLAGYVGSSTIYVGVIDEGVDLNHVDLSHARGNPNETLNGVDDDGNGYVDDTDGWDFVNNDRTVYDGGNGDKHGTHVAGTIGAARNGTGVVGVAPNVKIISAKFLGRNGGSLTNAIKAIDYFTNLKVNEGINILATNNSWSGGGYSQALKDAIDRAGAANIGFVAAAGNGGADSVGDNNDSTPTYPASYTSANIISVASITSTGARSSFSNYGATSVDLAAPGSSINSTFPKNAYGNYSGTSMATPHVCGAAVLYKAANPSADWSSIRSAILSSTTPTTSMANRCVTGGRLSVQRLLGLIP
ncbi:MAG TPA: S8 family peptidase [Fimbriimonadaceae bacterium]|nr:S8 family peptidase [Fimbriimonadaceae bacterium]